MSEMELNTEQEVSDVKLGMFSKLPSGWQRVIIAGVFVVILVGIVLLKQMIKTEEDVRENEGVV